MAPIPDSRHIGTGRVIPSEGYADQPYIVRTDDGAWLCVITTGRGAEGEPGQHVVTLRSTDQGKSWSPPVDVEPATGPEASYAVLLKAQGGRIYCFYNHNTDNVREVRTEDGGTFKRVDSLGHFVFKHSDDHGRTWSKERYEIPVREFTADRNNVYGGKLRFFWNVGKPVVTRDGAAIVPLHKVGAMGKGFFAQSEGAFLRSENLLTERDPQKIRWETLPAGEVGLRTPPGGGRISEEQSLVELSDGSLYCVYRSVDGHPVSTYSRDGGRSWSEPVYKSYTPGGKRFKHPRAANFVWRCSNGKYLYWFHNHGGSPARSRPDWDPYADRNPAWLCCGVERDGPGGKVLHWSQPEILLYDDDPFIRMSYPDLVEEGRRFFITETQKNVGRVHEIDAGLLRDLFGQWENHTVSGRGLLLQLSAERRLPVEEKMPRLPVFHQRDNSRPDHGGKDLRAGLTVELWLELPVREPGLIVLDGRNAAGQGFCVTLTDRGSLGLTLNDGRQEAYWESDPESVRPGNPQHFVAIVDGGPKIIRWLVDGVLCDGGEYRQFGWGRFSPTLRSVDGAPSLRIAPHRPGAVRALRLYGRAVTTSEAVGNFRAGLSGRA